MTTNILPSLLIQMAEMVDAPDGIGGGAILLAAAVEIERLQTALFAVTGSTLAQLPAGQIERAMWATDHSRAS